MSRRPFRHFLDLSDVSSQDLRPDPRLGAHDQGRPQAGAVVSGGPLAGKTVAMIFEQPRCAPASPSTSASANSAAIP